MQARRLANRREFLKLTVLSATGVAIVVACAPAAPPTVTPAPKAAEPTKPAAPATAAPQATTAPQPTSAPAATKPAAAPTAAVTPAAKPAAAKESVEIVYSTWWPQMMD